MDQIEALSAHIPGLGKKLRQFYECFFAEDYDGVLLLTHPKLFDLVPKKLMRKKLHETLHNKALDLTCDLLQIDKIGQLIEHEKGDFVKLDYTMLMAVRFKADDQVNFKKKKKQEEKAFMLSMFEEQYGKKNIWFDETTRTYCFYKKNCMVGIRDDASPQWTFLTIKKGPMMEAFLPKDVSIIFDQEMD